MRTKIVMFKNDNSMFRRICIDFTSMFRRICIDFTKKFYIIVYVRYIVSYNFVTSVCSETTLTGVSWFQISPPRGFEPVTLVVGSKQVSPLDQ
jgi:hypothetical protein